MGAVRIPAIVAFTGVCVGAMRAAFAVFAVRPDVIAPDCAGCIAGLASEEAPRVALAFMGACAFRVAAASAAGVFATSGDIAAFTI
jgi:hypothetical protein